MWQCEWVDRYLEPKVEIFYTVYDQESNDFFVNQFTDEIVQKVMDTTQELDIIPNPNKIIGCNPSENSCWNHKAHVSLVLKFGLLIIYCLLQWCLFLNQAGKTQIQTIRCTFQQPDSTPVQDRIQICAPNIFDEIVLCVDSLGESNSVVQGLQTRLNHLVEQSTQTAVEVIAKDQSAVKVKSSGILQELCYNYFEVDNATLGCQVALPKVQIFYETQSANVGSTFTQLAYQARYAPFETVAQFEFIPYGQTSYSNGQYTCTEGESQCEANWIHVSVTFAI